MRRGFDHCLGISAPDIEYEGSRAWPATLCRCICSALAFGGLRSLSPPAVMALRWRSAAGCSLAGPTRLLPAAFDNPGINRASGLIAAKRIGEGSSALGRNLPIINLTTRGRNGLPPHRRHEACSVWWLVALLMAGEEMREVAAPPRI